MNEAKSGREIGVWFTDQTVWGYRGTLPVVIQFEKKSVEHVWVIEDYVLSRCPPCERVRLSGRKVLRWLILPA